jgi:hypothetical protein
VTHVVDVLHPLALRLRGGLDACAMVLAQVRDAVGDPVGVLLDGHDHVAQHGGLPGPVMAKRFGKPATATPR